MLANLGEIGGRYSKAAAPSDHSISPIYFKRRVETKNISWASLDFGSKHPMPKVRKSAQKAGLRFEGQVLSSLQRQYGTSFATGVPLSFQEIHGKNFSRPAFAIPDGLLLSDCRKYLLCIEIKLRHSADAWFQLNRFYLPILRRVVGSSLVLRSLEICRYYDPGVRVPEAKELLLNPQDAFSIKPGKHSVLIWEKGA